nr:immunoglobulin heavy chain junction region [Mus musculus]
CAIALLYYYAMDYW